VVGAVRRGPPLRLFTYGLRYHLFKDQPFFEKRYRHANKSLQKLLVRGIAFSVCANDTAFIFVHLRGDYTHKEDKMRKLGTAAVALAMTLAMATGSWAQVGRDSGQGGTAAGTGSSTDSVSQKGGSMGQKGNSMQNGHMQKGSSGTVNK
jgi:hypothetical protein